MARKRSKISNENEKKATIFLKAAYVTIGSTAGVALYDVLSEENVSEKVYGVLSVIFILTGMANNFFSKDAFHNRAKSALVARREDEYQAAQDDEEADESFR